MSFLIGLILFFMLAIVVVLLLRKNDMWFTTPVIGDDVTHEVVTTTTTTTVHEPEPVKEPIGVQEYDIVGSLSVEKTDDGQRYVLDPVDKSRWYLNTNDDLYEDADGKIWQLKG